MPDWRIKAAIQGTLSLLPYRQKWNRLFQTYVTRSLTLTDSKFEQKWKQFLKHRDYQQRWGTQADLREITVLELGTGWFPIVSLGFALAGAKRVWTVDLSSLLSVDSVLAVLRKFHAYVANGEFSFADESRLQLLRDYAALGPNDPRYSSLTPTEILTDFGVSALVADARSAPIGEGTVDLFVSNNVFEHIPGPVLEGILASFRRYASEDALMSHYVDMGDHYSGFDKKISVYNYMKYPDWIWKFFNNPLQYQNRLRASDYVRIHEDTGWVVRQSDHLKGSVEELSLIRLAPAFKCYSREDLLVYGSWLISSKLESESSVTAKR